MRDVIVIGAGGGGPVVAKELAAHGLDVLVLEAGPWSRDPENEWTRFENDANNPLDGYFRFGPSDRFEKPAWFRETPQNSFLWQLAGVGGTTQHYYGNCPRAAPGVFAGFDGPGARTYDTKHRFPFSYEELVPYYEWVEATLPVQTAAMGTKEELFFEGAQGIGLPVNTTKDITRNSFRPQENAILQPGSTAASRTPTAGSAGVYTDHFFDWMIGVFDEVTGSSKGVGSSARCDFPGHGGLENVGLPPALEAFSMGFSDSGVRGLYDNGRGPTGAWDGKAGRLGGAELKEALADVNRLLNVLVITDDDVEAQNRVVRSSLPGDEQGPIPKVIFNQRKRSARTLANREYCADKAARLLRAAGARQVFRLDWPPLILHVQSTMRMGSSADDSVLDHTAEARFVKRLFVASNSALANGLGGPNPTLTSQALATRTSEKILAKYFDGEPFVGHQTPVSSIDDRVTQAVLDRRI